MLDDVSVTHKVPDARPAFYADDAQGIRLRNSYVDRQKVEQSKALLVQKNCSGIEIFDRRLVAGTI